MPPRNVEAGCELRSVGLVLHCGSCSPGGPFPNDNERRPQRRIGAERVRAVVHVREHGAPQRLRAAKLGIALQQSNVPGGERRGGIGLPAQCDTRSARAPA